MARVTVKEDAALIVLTAVALAVLTGLGSAWLLMLLFGMFAGYLGVPGLAIGYWATYGIYLMLRLIFVKASADD
jgi:hypothetical protein